MLYMFIFIIFCYFQIIWQYGTGHGVVNIIIIDMAINSTWLSFFLTVLRNSYNTRVTDLH